jgi:PAS domain S-box-containing protein
MSNYQNKTKEELIIELGKLQELNNLLVSSDKKKEKKYDKEEQMLLEKDLQFSKLSANMPDLIFQFTRRTDGSYFVPIASAGIKNIFGCTPEDVVDDFTPIASVIYPEDVERVMNDIEYSAKHLTIFTCEHRVQLPGKEIQWILSKSTPEKLPDGSVTWYGFNANITEQKKAEERLKKAALLLQSSIESPKDMIILSIDKNYNYLYFNEFHRLTMLHAYGQAIKIGMNLLACITTEEDRLKAKINYEKALNGESHITIEEYGALKKSYYETRYNPIFNDKNEIIGTTAFSVDITDRNQTEKDLRESEYRYRKIYEDGATGMVMVNKDFKFLTANRTFCQMVGYQEEELKQLTFLDITHPDDKDKDIPQIKKMLAGEIDVHRTEKRYLNKNGQTIWAQLTLSTFHDSNGQFLYNLAIIINITERKKAELDLIRMSRIMKNSQEIAHLGSFEYVVADQTTIWSEEEYNIYGLDPNSPSPEYNVMLEKCIHPDDAKLLNDTFMTAMQNQEFYELEHRIVRPDGSVRWVYDQANPYFDEQGNLLRYVGATLDITERKQAEEKFREIYALLNFAGEKAKLGGWIVNLDENRCFWTNEVAAIHEVPIGYSPLVEEGIGFYAPEWRDKITEVFTNCVQNGVPYDEEMQILTSKGKRVWVRTIGEAVKDSSGKTVKVQGAFQDITARKIADEALRDSETKLKRILVNLQDAYFQADLSGNFTFVNPSAVEMYGYDSIEEMLGLPASGLYADKKVREHLIESLRILGKIKDYEGRGLKKDGSSFWVSMSVQFVRDNNDQIIGTEGVVRDISDRKKTEEQILKLSQAVEQSPASIILTDTKGNIEYANPTALKITGYTLEDLKGKNPRIFSSGEKPKNDYINLWETILSGKEWRGEFHNKKKNGDLFWELASISPIINEKGEIINFLAVKEDITKSKQIEKDLIAAKEHAEESDRLKSAFLANMSHEIRTPMNGILGFAGLLKEPGISGEKQQKYIEIIQKSGGRMLNIINDIVDISKIESGQMEVYITETDINEKIENLYQFFKPEAEAKNIQFCVTKTLPKNEAINKTDSEKVYAVLTNLLKNAIKFTNKGEITFGVGYESAAAGKKQLKFFVKDTGMGIAKDRQKAIFERFIQADIYDRMALQGAGLGLSISKAYVEMLGGKIWAESEQGIGSVFYFTIPCIGKTEEIIEQNSDVSIKTDDKAGKLKILIAEDDEASLIYLSILVEEFSSEILTAKNGFEAVEIYKHHPDIDLILMDIQMPYLNGYEATSQIRKLNKNVVIIAQTAFALSYDRQKVMEAGCNDYIAKPIMTDDLKTLLRKYFT